jgi:seryl-tRNA synthetase
MLVARGDDPGLVDQILALDARRRQLLVEEESLRAERKRGSRIGPGQQLDQGAREALRAMGERIEALARERADNERLLQALYLRVPNLIEPGVPIGHSEEENVEVRAGGEPRRFDFAPRPHWDLGERLDIIDLPTAAKLAGTRFALLKGGGALLERALMAFMLDLHTREHGYLEIAPPYLVRAEVAEGSGQLPRFADTMYHDAEDDLWLIPTAEVPLVNLHRQSIIEPGLLPLSYVAATPCFRRERMAAGRDVRGIKRVHQFHKVEMVKYTPVSASGDPVPGGAAVQRRDGLRVPAHLRHQHLGAGFGGVAGGVQLLERRRLPGAPGGDPLPPGVRRAGRVRPHPQRVRGGAAADDDRGAGELPAAGRQRGDPARLAALHARVGADLRPFVTALCLPRVPAAG